MYAPVSLFAMESISNMIMYDDAVLKSWLEIRHGNFCNIKEQFFFFFPILLNSLGWIFKTWNLQHMPH